MRPDGTADGIGTAMMELGYGVTVDETELQESFVRASGPGGQNVNTVSTAVQLRFDVRNAPGLPEAVRARLERAAGRRLTQDGVLVIAAPRFRSLARNREEARERLFDLIRRAAVPPTPRRPTRPTLGSKQRRLEGKAKRATVKGTRRSPPTD